MRRRGRANSQEIDPLPRPTTVRQPAAVSESFGQLPGTSLGHRNIGRAVNHAHDRADSGRLLALLAEERGRIVSRRTLLREVWRFERADHLETRTVDMHVAKLRKKLGAARDLIETVRGEGYRLLA